MGTSHTSSWHLNSAASSANSYTAEGKRNGKTVLLQLRSILEANPLLSEQVKTWNMCLNRCPHSALQWYVLLPESNKGQKEKSAQKYLHILTVYSWMNVNVVWKMNQNNHRCSTIKITFFPLVLITYTYKQICLLCIDFMDKHNYLYTKAHTHVRKYTEATINYSHPIWEH